MIRQGRVRRMAAASLVLGLILNASFGVAPAAADDDKAVVDKREATAFTSIRTEGDFLMTINVGDEYSVEIEAEPRDVQRISTDVEDGVLVIRYRERFFSFIDNSERLVRIGMPDLGELVLLGEADVVATGIDSDAFRVEIAGSADVKIEGRCGDLTIETSGMGDVSAEGLKCERTTLVVNGMGDASVYASQSVNVLVNGMGDVDVYGNPEEVTESINGIGAVDMK